MTVIVNQPAGEYYHFPLKLSVTISPPTEVYGYWYGNTPEYSSSQPYQKSVLAGQSVAEPTPDAVGDIWYNYSSKYLFAYSGMGNVDVGGTPYNRDWIVDPDGHPNEWMTSHKVYTDKASGKLLGYVSVSHTSTEINRFQPIYYYAHIYLVDADTNQEVTGWNYNVLNGVKTTFDLSAYPYSPSSYSDNHKRYFLRVEYTLQNKSNYFPNANPHNHYDESDVFQVYGYKGTHNYLGSQQITRDCPDYPILNKSKITVTYRLNVSSSYPASEYVETDNTNPDYHYGVQVFYEDYITSYALKTLSQAVADGDIEVISQNYTYGEHTITYIPKRGLYGAIVFRVFFYNNSDTATYLQMTSGTVNLYVEPTPLLTTAAGSIVPAQWVYNEAHDNAHAVNGLPPYQVTFTDSSTYTNAVPVKKWSINFGDSASGVVNSLEYSNASGQQQTYHANSVHTFDGYGDYYVTLTLTDMTDKEHRYTYTFAPTKAHRFITNPLNAITPTSDLTVPQIMTCDVVVAGYPEPETSWTYAHTNGIYTATKEGQYAQFALSEGGLYTISFLSTQTGSSNLTISKNITVSANSANTLSTDNPISQGDFVTWLYVSGNRYCPIPVSTPIIRWNYADGKQLTFHVPLSWENLSYLRPGCLVSCGYNGIARPFVVYSRSNNQDTGYAEIQCYDYAQTLFDSRVATAATNSLSDNGYDVQTYYGESLMRYFAISNLGTGRSDSIFMRIGTDAHAGGTQTYSARYETISSIISDLCGNTQLGWDVCLQNSSGDVSYLVGWKPISGSDRSATVIFSEEFMTADIGVFTETVSPSVALGAGQGEGAARTYVEYDVSGGTPVLTGINRREIFVDAGDAADSNEVKRMSVLELENGKQMTFYITPLPDSPYVFGTDYAVGDFVSIYDKSLSATPIKVRIKSAQYAQTSTGVKLELTCGTTQPSAWNLIQRNMQANTYARK